jgi:Helix-hairpin-helix motif
VSLYALVGLGYSIWEDFGIVARGWARVTHDASRLQPEGEGSRFEFTLPALVEALRKPYEMGIALEPVAVPEMDVVDDLAPCPPPVPHMRKRRRHPGRSILFTVWALVPALTLGWCTPFTFTYAALRMRSALLGWCTAIYAVVTATAFLLLSNANENSWQVTVGTTLFLLEMAIGTAHAFALRPRLMNGPTTQQLALADANARLRLRWKARRLFVTNSALADELRIGRPDLPRRFDDGGLVDVNHAPQSALTEIPGISNELAEQISLVRDGIGGFDSLDDLSVTLGLPPQSLDRAADFLVFRRGSDRPLAQR